MLFRFIAVRPVVNRTSTSAQSIINKTPSLTQCNSQQKQLSSFSQRTYPSLLPVPPVYKRASKDIHSSPHSRHRTYSTPMAAPTDTAAEQVANTTGITPDTLAQTLREKLDATHVEIHDISGGCGASFTALIVSAQFQGKAALARHRLVNSALKAEIAAIHAWTPKCLTPEQWEQQQQTQQQAQQ